MTDSVVIVQTRNGLSFEGVIRRFTKVALVAEIHGADVVLRASEALENAKIVFGDRTIYSGPGVVLNVVMSGPSVICELKLDEACWLDLRLDQEMFQPARMHQEFRQFVVEWQKLYRILPEFKIAVADMQSFLFDLRLWLDQVELNIRSQPASGDAFERKVLSGLSEPVMQNLGLLFERFEHITGQVDKDLRAPHAIYAQRHLHPLVLCAPFMYRTFRKPLGYAGDYEMVNMMTRDSFQGGSIFAKVLNTFFLNTPPVVAHRNRIDYLYSVLLREIDRVNQQGRVARILNLGWGRALEIQALMERSPRNPKADFTLLDFNNETVEHASGVLSSLSSKTGRSINIHVLKKSVAQFLKEQSKPVPSLGQAPFDLVYCAGLFDYLADPICEKLLAVFYSLIGRGGLVVATNVDLANPSRGWMEYMVDWYLCYRDSNGMKKLMPQVPDDQLGIVADATGVNVLLEARKLENA